MVVVVHINCVHISVCQTEKRKFSFVFNTKIVDGVEKYAKVSVFFNY
jgi:hypothetical protein